MEPSRYVPRSRDAPEAKGELRHRWQSHSIYREVGMATQDKNTRAETTLASGLAETWRGVPSD
jgi:hypothetical protein